MSDDNAEEPLEGEIGDQNLSDEEPSPVIELTDHQQACLPCVHLQKRRAYHEQMLTQYSEEPVEPAEKAESPVAAEPMDKTDPVDITLNLSGNRNRRNYDDAKIQN